MGRATFARFRCCKYLIMIDKSSSLRSLSTRKSFKDKGSSFLVPSDTANSAYKGASLPVYERVKVPSISRGKPCGLCESSVKTIKSNSSAKRLSVYLLFIVKTACAFLEKNTQNCDNLPKFSIMRKMFEKTVYNRKNLWYNDTRWRKGIYAKAFGIKT